MARAADIKFVLCCDEVRKEDNGKLFAIGIYGENIILRKVPSQINMAFLLWASASEPGDYEADVNLYLEPQLDAVAELNLGFTAHATVNRVQLVVPSIPLNIGGKGALVFRQKINGEEKEIFRMPILESQLMPKKENQ